MAGSRVCAISNLDCGGNLWQACCESNFATDACSYFFSDLSSLTDNSSHIDSKTYTDSACDSVASRYRLGN